MTVPVPPTWWRAWRPTSAWAPTSSPTTRTHWSAASTRSATALVERRERYGISYITFGVAAIESVAPIVERLTGT